MKKNMLLGLALLGCLFMFTACGNDGTPKKEPASGEIIATINGEKISKDIYDTYYEMGKADFESMGINMDSADSKQFIAYIEQNAWEQTLYLTLILQEAKNLGVSVPDKEVTAYYNEQVDDTFSSREEYAKWLEQSNMTERQVWETMQINLSAQNIYNKLGEDITITDEDVKAAYEKEPLRWETRKASHIIIQPADDSEEAQKEAENKVKDLIRQLDEGADFATLAKENGMDGTASNGGSLGEAFGRYDSNYAEEFVVAVYDLENEGDYSKEPVKTSFGYHVIKLDEKNDDFDQLKDSIKEKLLTAAKDEAYSNCLTDLEQNAVVEMNYTFQYYMQPENEESKEPTGENTENKNQ